MKETRQGQKNKDKKTRYIKIKNNKQQLKDDLRQFINQLKRGDELY